MGGTKGLSASYAELGDHRSEERHLLKNHLTYEIIGEAAGH